ncbi:MAG: HD domain-containing protein [Tissierellia bacterium]|nr:HD domain-containing protein [Tissierellia bacterium]
MSYRDDLEFIVLLEKMKSVYRMTKVIGEDRRENDAEHSWHVAINSMILQPHSKIEVDINRVIQMMLVHDIVEIYAGDTFAYDTKANEGKKNRELEAMQLIKSQLSESMGDKIEGLWLEFEDKMTNEAKYANAMDRLQPIMSNIHDGRGGTWFENNVTYQQVLDRIAPIKDFNDQIYEYVVQNVDKAVENGYIIRN